MSPRRQTPADKHRLLLKRIVREGTPILDAHSHPSFPRIVPVEVTARAILEMLVTGTQWKYLQSSQGSWQLHYKRFRIWEKEGLFQRGFEEAARDYIQARAGIDRILVDGTYVKAKSGGALTGRVLAPFGGSAPLRGAASGSGTPWLETCRGN
jgi:transposase